MKNTIVQIIKFHYLILYTEKELSMKKKTNIWAGKEKEE